MKRRFFWIAALFALLAAAAFGPALFGLPESSFAGLTIYLFLGYCGIIVVSQILSCLAGLRATIEQETAKRPASQRLTLR